MARILIADDERPLRIALERFVRSLGMEPEAVGSGTEALERLATCDLLLSDVRMPGLDGMQLLAEARRRRPGLPVVLLTGYGTVSTAFEAMRAGATNVLTKPFDLEELEQVIRAALERAAPGRPTSSGPRTDRTSSDALVGASPTVSALRDLVSRVSSSDAAVLLTGESGCGKEIVARTIHGQGKRAKGPFIAVSCAAIPETLLESELFGHVKGAFTGATQTRIGHIAAAEGGSLLLDEIGELPLSMQVKLLRVLQERAYTPVGDSTSRAADVRVIAATHRDLEAMVAAGTFREDLFYRLNVLAVPVPPLRDRGDDVLLLAFAFLARAAAGEGRLAMGMDEDVKACLRRYAWPGNVRELEHAITRATVLSRGDTLSIADLPPRVRAAYANGVPAVPKVMPLVPDGGNDPQPVGSPVCIALPEAGLDLRATLDHVERDLIRQALERTGGNRNRAAALLGMNRTTLVEKLKRS